MKENIKKIICDVLGREIDIDDTVDIRTYGMDSMLKVQLVIGIEDLYDIEFAEEDLDQNKFKCVNDICDIVANYFRSLMRVLWV